MTIFFPGLATTQFGALEISDELDTPILISLFSWARAQDGDVIGNGDKQGWWGDDYPDVEGDRFGSRLWILRNQPISKAVLNAPALGEEALQWLVEDGLVKSVKCTAALDIHQELTLTVLIEKFPVRGKQISSLRRTYRFPLH